MVKKDKILRRVDLTDLKAFATWGEICKLCEEAIKYHTASVCIPPSFVKRVHEAFPELNICTVIGFPLGYNTTACKVFETKDAIANGASEIDMVINIGDVKSGHMDSVEAEITAIRAASKGKILKVIIETCYLNDNEKMELCKCVTNAKADYIKTSTGFGTSGATLEDINLFKEHIGNEVKIKAAGGIRTEEAMSAFCEAGCDRIGCSAAVKVLCS